ncbi:MAG: 2,3-diphosphoglycerate-dependent phosphoglycerate mutase [Bacteroidales bacterium]|nr:2,3-diphosphoglycerate-dependent phosphoglycerate mutase [Bacteroidales bacterium]
MKRLILLRHGQSQWNLENRFTGWTDVDLSDKGREEARAAGLKMLQAGVLPRYYFTSSLRRAIHTLQIAADAMDRSWVPVTKDWHLNERHYGALQGLNKADTAARFGEEQVHTWRRSFDVRPPALTIDDERYPGHDERYAALTVDELPLTESLADTIRRVYACWEERIAPAIRLYDTVLVAAHGNSLRALAKLLLHISDADIVNLEIPTGSPWLFELDDDRLQVISNRYL